MAPTAETVMVALAACGCPPHRLRGGKEFDATCPSCSRVRAIRLRADHAGRAIVGCLGGCSRPDVLAALGLEGER